MNILGGSYAQFLAAWFRIKYPHLVPASAPLLIFPANGYNCQMDTTVKSFLKDEPTVLLRIIITHVSNFLSMILVY